MGIFGLFVLALIQTGCQSTPKSEPTVKGDIGSAEGQWRGKALARNLVTGKSGVLDIEIIAREPNQLRMEITGSFSTPIASIAMNGSEVRYILSQEKRFVSAPAGADTFSRLVPVHIPPAALLAVLFDRDLPAGDWTCDRDAATHLVSFCAYKTEDVGVKWLERNGRNRRLKILSKDAEIELVLDEAKSKVEPGPNVFTLTPPDGYKRERAK